MPITTIVGKPTSPTQTIVAKPSISQTIVGKPIDDSLLLFQNGDTFAFQNDDLFLLSQTVAFNWNIVAKAI